MRAAIISEYGADPEVGEHPDPEGDGVVEVLAAGMNPVDLRIATGTYAAERPQPPYVAGKEGIARRADGSLVYFDASVAPFGAFAPRTKLRPGAGYPVPEGLDPGLAVSLGVSGIAAWVALEWRGRLAAGETVLVLGASGVVGQIAVQAAQLLGAGRVVAAARDAGGLERAGALGADATVALPGGDEPPDELAARLREAAGGDGFDLVLDPLWGVPARAALGAMRPLGRLVQAGQSAGATMELPSAAVRGPSIDILGYTNYMAGEERKAAAFAALAAHAAAGRIEVPVERHALDDVPEAWRRQGSSPHAKLVVVP